MSYEWMLFLRLGSALILATAIVVTVVSVRRLRVSNATYNARLLPFAYYSLLSWSCLFVGYFLLAVMESRPVELGLVKAQGLMSTLGTTFLSLAALVLHSRRPHRPQVAVPFALALWLVAVSYLIAMPLDHANTVWAVAAVLDAVLLWSVIPAVVRLHITWLYAVPFALYGVLQLLWVTRSALVVLASIGVVMRALLLLAWNRIILVMLSRAERSYAAVVSTIDALEIIPGCHQPFQVMISSTVSDLYQERDAAERAITSLHLRRFCAETFGSLPHTPRLVCEFMARSCDVMILIIGERYGHVIEPEQISVVEFEYTIARSADPRKILVYVKTVERSDERLLKFLGEVEDFERGYFRSTFGTPEQLYEQIHADVARWLVARAVGVRGERQTDHGMQPAHS